MIVLAGDIGGTKTLLQLSRSSPGGLEVLHEKRYASVEYGEFLALASQFVEESFQLTGVRLPGHASAWQARSTGV